MFLSRENVLELTGCKRKSDAIRWLRDRRYPFDIGADGWPKVLHSYVQAKLGGSTKFEPRLRLEA